MATKPLQPFVSFPDAINGFFEISVAFQQESNRLSLISSFSVSNHSPSLIRSSSNAYAKNVLVWWDRTKHLGVWSISDLEKLFSPPLTNAARPENNSLSAKEHDRSIIKQTPVYWMALSSPLSSRLTHILADDLRFPPHRFIPSVAATLLGSASYMHKAKLVKILLKQTSIPECRLIIEAHHFKTPPDPTNYLLGSSLLHRLVVGMKSLSNNPNGKTEAIADFKAATSTLDAIIKYDPEGMLVCNHRGDIPDALAAGTDIGSWLETRRRTWMASTRYSELKSLVPNRRKPPHSSKGVVKL